MLEHDRRVAEFGHQTILALNSCKRGLVDDSDVNVVETY